MVRFTGHALDQMMIRGISREEVLQVLDHPEETVITRAGRLASYALSGERYIVVIHEKEDDENVVITSMRVDKRRLRSFGFTEV
ncbi:MAG: DUF4258 domain-containing protein [Candidatus Bathyarchaeia archaeon]